MGQGYALPHRTLTTLYPANPLHWLSGHEERKRHERCAMTVCRIPALVTREQFIQVQDRLEETSRMKRESRTRISTGKEGANAKNGTNRGDHPGNLGPGG